MQLNHKILGQGEPLIILHGLFGMLDNWQSIAKKMAEHFMVILVDQRDHGRSPHTNDFSYPLLAEDLRTFMEENWIYEANILGHSMGGKTAMELALKYPDLVQKLIVVDIAPVRYAPAHDGIFEALLSIDLSTIDDRREVQEALMEKLKVHAIVQFLMKNLSRHKDGHYVWKMNLSLLHEKYNAILDFPKSDHTYDGPSLFIKGERSDYILPEYDPEILRLFPQAQLQIIADAGHWVHADKPDALLSEISVFLES